LVLGEVHTGLLQHASSLPPPACERLLGLAQGERVRRFERPIAHAASPDLLTGVDCQLATASGARVRGVGTVLHRASVTGGHVLQGSAVARLAKGEAGRRLPWQHYLAQPGQVETLGKPDWGDLVRGFLTSGSASSGLDLAAINGRLMDAIQRSPELDRRPPFRATRTRLRWVAVLDDATAADDQLGFRIETRQLRTVWLRCGPDQVAAVTDLCEDLALHDWLLTTLLDLLERSRIGSGPRRHTVERLSPAIDHLLHLWMPGARVDRAVAGIWETLEGRGGFSRQWHASENRIRDQFSLSIIAQLRGEPARSR
jgi:hypothetical protein